MPHIQRICFGDKAFDLFYILGSLAVLKLFSVLAIPCVLDMSVLASAVVVVVVVSVIRIANLQPVNFC